VIVKECIKLLRSSLPSTIDIRQAIETRPSVVIADPTQIHQVLMNLCTNAFHAMKEKGGILEVTLSHERMETGRPDAARDLEAGGYVKLSVRDTGHGIDPAIRSRIFEPFFTTKQQGEGTGLGMSVVWGIVKSCGGAIDVASEVGVGTTISVYLPLVDSAEPADHDATEEIVGGHERVLFVDDEETLAELGERILGTLGYRVTASSSSLEALELFRGKHREFDLVFADLTMPGMTGVELAGEMLSIRPDIPIILCTGYSESITEERAREIGVRQVVTKPMVRKEIGRVIRDTLSPG
jgi:CheY-like chemotaxis protein